MIPIKLPVTPNAPILKNGNQIEGDFQLKKFGSFGFLKNVKFNPDLIIYDKNYQNDQSFSPRFKVHLSDTYKLIKTKFTNGSKLVEVGCGKGTFLDLVKKDNYFKYEGFDNTYEGDDPLIHSRYLTSEDRIYADIVVLRHTLEHIQAPHKFLEMLNIIFGNNALIFIEVPQFDWIDKSKVIFDLSYEHVNYFNTRSLCSLFSRVLDFGDFFEGQYQYCFAKLSLLDKENWKNFDLESNWKSFDISEYYKKFNSNIDFLKSKQRIWIWGGASKGVLFLNHLSNLYPLLFKKVVGVVDLNIKKQSFYTPSTNIKIISEKEMFYKAKKGDVVLVMNPNYYDEIKKSVESNVSHKLEIFNI